jgi:hypothetical protein
VAQAAFLTHLTATLAVVGIIWFVQVVHYPLFERVGKRGCQAYSAAHSRLTGLVVGPPMLVEAATAVALPFSPPSEVPAALAWTGLALLAFVWLSTVLLQVPCHRALGLGFDPRAHRLLMLFTWVHTAAWRLRGLLVLSMAAMG